MAYGSDITEELPHVLSNPVGAVSYSANGESYDISINDMAFFLNTGDEFPYTRQTAQYRKQQIDQSNEPGEQSITGWWVRSQSSFHRGSGIKFYDPSSGETVSYRFADSKGINIWEKGKVSLLNSSTQGHVTTGAITSKNRTQQFARSITWSGTNGILLVDEYDADKIASDGTVTHFIDYNSGTDSPVYALCDDGTYAYWITNTSTKKTVYKKLLTLDSGTAGTKMFDEIGTISNATMEYVKERIVLCADNKVYEFASSASALPSPVFTHPTNGFTYTSITASGPAIYLSGYNEIQSTIQKFTLSTAGAMPSLTSAVVAAELPVGEVAHKIFYYLGYMIIGTNKGIRVAAVNDQDGSLSYGPLIVETSQPVYDFAARDKYVWATTGVSGEPGLIRINLGEEIEALRFAYANDLYYPGVTATTTACAFAGTTSLMMYSTAYANSTNGNVYRENASSLISEGSITTGKIRYATLENKVFKILKARVDNTNGSLNIKSIDYRDEEYSIGTFSQGDFTPEVSVNYPIGAQEHISIKFTISRSTTDSSKGPTFSGYYLKALPAVARQRIISYPLACYDRENDSFGNQVGYEGSAYDKLTRLEIIEKTVKPAYATISAE
jgi:hypothetical protein